MTKKKNIFEETSIIVKKNYSDKHSKVQHRIHTNDGHELYLLLEGDVSFSIDGSIYKLVPNDVLIISNREIHKAIVNKEVPHDRIYIYFDPEYIARFDTTSYDLLQMFEHRRHGFGNKISADLVMRYNLGSYFEDIYKWHKSDAPEKNIMMLTILLQLIVKINTICGEYRLSEERLRQDVEYNDKIYEIIRYISSNLDKKITLENIEKQFFIDKYYLCHLFKNITGYTVLDYINYKKVLSAKEQLKKGIPIGSVWVQYGFYNYSSFYRTFKKTVGLSPTEYATGAIQKSDRIKNDRFKRTTTDLQ